MAMSASMKRSPWNDPTGEPNWRRVQAYSSARSKAPCAMPSACAPTPGRETSNVFMAVMKPVPSRPRQFATGTRQSWKISSRVAEARMPSLSSFLPKVKPGVPFSTMMQEAPRGPLAGFVRAMTV